ncbi:MAG: penicillin acylase family protein [Vicinamibacterales bacterium]
MSHTRWVVVAIALAGAIGIGAQSRGEPERLALAGLEQPVEILRDRWGVNHIYAANEHDLFFAQGYAAARDRLFQFEVWRRQATGTVAEILGPKALPRDTGTRLHMFRGDLDAELNWYHPRGKAIVTAFVDGINACIDEALKAPAELPIEFRALGIEPRHWTPAVVISRHNGLLSNANQEIGMARAVAALGADGVKALSAFYGRDPLLDLDPAIDAAALDRRILGLYNASRAPLRFAPEDVLPQYRGAAAAAALVDDAAGPSPLDLSQRQEDIGSNNWVVAGRLTQTGKPLLMNDPHRVQGAPSLRYWAHLVGPGWNVIGGGEPTLPGISIGHNDVGAWGLTIFGTDTEDLYVYDTNPEKPTQYRYRGAWEEMRVVDDEIPVKGRAPEKVQLKYTRHGPVLFEDAARHKAYALRAAWLEIGAAPYLASLRFGQARSWDEFRDAAAFSRIPAENMIWADTSGTIGYQAVAITPIRRNWSGLVPVPGDGRYEWDGYLPIKALPHAVNPPAGYLVTANNYLFPSDYPYPDAQHYTGTDPFRATRIAEVLGSGKKHSVADMARLQNDDLSLPARALVPLLKDVALAPGPVAQARDALLAWDFVLDKDSVAAGIYEMWQRRLLAAMRDRLVPAAARGDFGGLSMKRVIAWLYAPDGGFGDDPIAARDQILVASLEAAVTELTKKLGPDMASWRYGQAGYHHALIRHPLGTAVTPELRRQLEVGPAPRGGDSYTVTATGGTDNQGSGGSLKIIADLDDWDASLAQNNPGQSGDPRSPHYRDLFELWARGRYFPIFYSRAKVASVTEHTLELQPATTSTARR